MIVFSFFSAIGTYLATTLRTHKYMLKQYTFAWNLLASIFHCAGMHTTLLSYTASYVFGRMTYVYLCERRFRCILLVQRFSFNAYGLLMAWNKATIHYYEQHYISFSVCLLRSSFCLLRSSSLRFFLSFFRSVLLYFVLVLVLFWTTSLHSLLNIHLTFFSLASLLHSVHAIWMCGVKITIPFSSSVPSVAYQKISTWDERERDKTKNIFHRMH